MNAAKKTSTTTTVTLSATEKWAVRLGSLLLWALIAASLLYWLLSAPRIDANTKATSVAQSLNTNNQQLARLLGAATNTDQTPTTANNSAISTRVQLRGVIAQNDQQGVAILSVDNQAFKPYQSGQKILDDWQIQSVQGRTVTLAKGKQSVTVELPKSPSNEPIENAPALERYPTAQVAPTTTPAIPPPNPSSITNNPQLAAPQTNDHIEPTEFGAQTISPNSNADLQIAIETAQRQPSKPRQSGLFRH